jgi:hypothetical protein
LDAGPGSSAPLLQGSLRLDPGGGASALLLVQAQGWQLLLARQHHPDTGLPAAWTRLASQACLPRPGPLQAGAGAAKAVRFSMPGPHEQEQPSPQQQQQPLPQHPSQQLHAGSLAGGMLLPPAPGAAAAYTLALWQPQGSLQVCWLSEQGAVAASQQLPSSSVAAPGSHGHPSQPSQLAAPAGAGLLLATTGAAACLTAVLPALDAGGSPRVVTQHGTWAGAWGEAAGSGSGSAGRKRRMWAGAGGAGSGDLEVAGAGGARPLWGDGDLGAGAAEASSSAGTHHHSSKQPRRMDAPAPTTASSGSGSSSSSGEGGGSTLATPFGAAAASPGSAAPAGLARPPAGTAAEPTGPAAGPACGAQRVTRLLLLGSERPGLLHVAACSISGALTFHSLAGYSLPRPAAGAPNAAHSAAGGAAHWGEVTAARELRFICPPPTLVGPAWRPLPGTSAATSGAPSGAVSVAVSRTSSLPSMSATPGGGGSALHSGGGAAGGPWGHGSAPDLPAAGASHHLQRGGGGSVPSRLVEAAAARLEAAATSSCASSVAGSDVGAGWAPAVAAAPAPPPPGGRGSMRAVPLLLTGGADGSVAVWDLRSAHLGSLLLCVHPHTAAVRQFVLPPVAARLPWSSCVLSVAEDGGVALLCLASRRLLRTFVSPLPVAPLQLAWSTSRWGGGGTLGVVPLPCMRLMPPPPPSLPSLQSSTPAAPTNTWRAPPCVLQGPAGRRRV